MITLFRKHSSPVLYVVESTAPLAAEALDRLTWLFGGATLLDTPALKGFFVGTRRELVTPWSTNAVEIVRNMNIPSVTRIEEFSEVSGPDASVICSIGAAVMCVSKTVASIPS